VTPPQPYASAVALADGRVLVLGLKSAGAEAAAMIFDPGTGESTAAAVPGGSRGGAALFALPGGQVLAIGGADDDTVWANLSSVEVFYLGEDSGLPDGCCDPAPSSWVVAATPLDAPPDAFREGALVRVVVPAGALEGATGVAGIETEGNFTDDFVPDCPGTNGCAVDTLGGYSEPVRFPADCADGCEFTIAYEGAWPAAAEAITATVELDP
jgi:hypothetical protein